MQWRSLDGNVSGDLANKPASVFCNKECIAVKRHEYYSRSMGCRYSINVDREG